MITRFEVDGFKSLRNFAMDFEPLTVLVGPNSAGKSNILEALALLSRLCSMSLDEAFKLGRGRAIDQFTRSGGEAGKAIRFAVEVFLEGIELPEYFDKDASLLNRYRYELTIERRARRSGAEELAVAEERLVTRTETSAVVESKLDVENALINAVTAHLARYRVLHLDASRLRDSSERIGATALSPDASNLPTVLADLPEPMIGEIRADLVSLVPGLSSFEVVPEDESFRIDFELSSGERLPARLVSDGTLRALALLTALRVEPRSSVIGIEEPENGVYPGRLRRLLELLQECAAPTDGENQPAAPTQILLTTHSPIVLAAFRNTPERLRFIDLVRRDGRLATRARCVGVLSSPAEGATVVSLREVDDLLHTADSEAAE